MMVKRSILLGFSITCAMLLAVVLISASVNANSAPPSFHRLSQSVNMQQGGVPAVPQRSDGKLLTAADISHYVTTHQSAAGPTVSGTPPQVYTDRLVTSKESETLLKGEQTGTKDNVMVHVVILHGPFLLENIITPSGVKVSKGNYIFEVFDAQTGNLLEWGVYS